MEIQLGTFGEPKASKALEVSDKVFGADYNEALVHSLVTAYLTGARAGTKAQKNRSDVRGGGAKPWRQKGTGRARAGTIRSPIWRSGGVTFAARPRTYQSKVNKKAYRAGLRSIFSELARQERLVVVDAFSLEQPKTKLLLEKVKQYETGGHFLLVDVEVNENLHLAARNLVGVETCNLSSIDPVALVQYDNVVITEAALRKLEEWLA